MKEITKELLENLATDSIESPRKRAHYNLHPELIDPIQRLIVSAEKGTYIRPHRHIEDGKFELFIILEGDASILTFDDNGKVLLRADLIPNGTRIVEIPEKTWHTLVVNEKSTLVEIKPGPYSPLSDKDFALWAPDEGDERAFEFEKIIRNAKEGDIVS